MCELGQPVLHLVLRFRVQCLRGETCDDRNRNVRGNEMGSRPSACRPQQKERVRGDKIAETKYWNGHPTIPDVCKFFLQFLYRALLTSIPAFSAKPKHHT